MKKFELFLLALLLPFMAFAYDAKINSIYYNFSENEAEVTYKEEYNFDNSFYYGFGCITDYSGTVVIPKSVTYKGRSYTVTRINEFAFCCCRRLKSIIISDSVTSIGKSAFFGCTGLISVIIGNGVYSIGEYAFSDCSGLTSVTIPNSVYSIGEYAFSDCRGLISITIPHSVTNIGDHAFYACMGLKKVIVPDIAAWCSISFGDFSANPLYLAAQIFSDEETEITNLVIPEHVTTINDYAFENCSGLTSVTIGNNVTSIGESSFQGCSGLTSIKVEIANPTYDSRNDCNAIIETVTNTLIVGCCKTIIPNSITKIGDHAFDGRSGLTSITIPNNVTIIGDYAFSCTDQISVTIGNSVTCIGSWAFSACRNLKSVTIPNNVIKIGSYAFYNCTDFAKVYIQNSRDNVEIGEDAIPIYTHVVYEKSCPPSIFITKNSLCIKGPTVDNEIYSNSKCFLVAQVHNDGDQDAQMCEAKVSLQGTTNGIKIENKETYTIEAGKTKEISIPFQTSLDTRNGEVTFTLQIIEKNGYDSDTASVTIPINAHGTNQLSAEGLKHRRAADELVKVAKKPEDLLGAIEEYKLILDTDPSYSDAYYNLAELYKKIGNEMDKMYYSDAKSYYIQFKRLVPEESAEIDDKLYLLERLMKQ